LKKRQRGGGRRALNLSLPYYLSSQAKKGGGSQTHGRITLRIQGKEKERAHRTTGLGGKTESWRAFDALTDSRVTGPKRGDTDDARGAPIKLLLRAKYLESNKHKRVIGGRGGKDGPAGCRSRDNRRKDVPKEMLVGGRA